MRKWQAQFKLRNVSASAIKFFFVTITSPIEVFTKSSSSALDSQKYDKLKQAILSAPEKTKANMLGMTIKIITISELLWVYL